jgi:YidC/Oxa1 family membrane protein insertase
VLRESPRVAIETPSLKGSINLKGARIDDLVLTRHTETIASDSAPIRLFSPGGTQDSYFATLGWQGQGVGLPDGNAQWTASAPRLTPGSPVTLSWDNGQGLLFEIVLSVDENYLFTAEQRVSNRSGGPVAVQPFQLVSRVGQSKDRDDWTMHVGPVGFFNGAADYNNDYSTLVDERQRTFGSTGGWLGFSDKYWLAAIIPDQGQQVNAGLRHNPTSNSFQADVTVPPVVVGPNQVSRTTTRLYAGAKEVNVLEAYDDQLGTRIDKAIDWGWYEWFMRPIFTLAAVAVLAPRQFRRGDHLPDPHRPPAPVPDRPAPVQILREDARHPAEGAGAPGALQGRQAAHAAGDAEALQGRKGEPGRRLPADPAPDPDLLRALPRADRRGGDAPPALRRVDQGPDCARPADSGQCIRLPAL